MGKNKLIDNILHNQNYFLLILLIIIFVLFAFAFIVASSPVPGPNSVSPWPAKIQIANSLKINGMSGITTTAIFQMNPDEVISSTNFQDKLSLAPQSILFCIKENSFDSTTESNIALVQSEVSSVKWGGAITLRVKAKVMCEPTGEIAESSIKQLNAKNCPIAQYCGDSQPCCAVVLEKV